MVKTRQLKFTRNGSLKKQRYKIKIIQKSVFFIIQWLMHITQSLYFQDNTGFAAFSVFFQG